MLTVDEARRRVLDAVGQLPAEAVPFDRCRLRVTAAPVVSAIDVPPFDNSAMDGYAVRAQDVEGAREDSPVTLPVVTVSAAGHPADRAIGPGQAARILTGAVMVDGADTIVPVEATDGGTDTVSVRSPSTEGRHVRRAGEDVVAGAEVVPEGTRLRSAHLGLVATVGAAALQVHRVPRVAIVSTGDELQHPADGPLAPGQIYDSNRFVLAALLRGDFGVEAPTTYRCADDRDRVRSDLLDLAGDHQLILSTGGVSMGAEYDVVKTALSDLGVEFWQTAMKPAKPMGFGHVGEAVFFGLPGNPVSAIVAFEVFVRPAVRKMVGVEPVVPPLVERVAGEALRRPDDAKTHFLRVLIGTDGRIRSTGTQGSHIMSGLAAADALAVLSPDRLEVPPGAPVPTIPLEVVT